RVPAGRRCAAARPVRACRGRPWRESHSYHTRVTLQGIGYGPIIRVLALDECPMRREHDYHPMKVADVIDETSDTRSFVIEIPPARAESFTYAAGQFCTFRAMIAGEPIIRCYSMSSSPDTGDPFTVTVKRVLGGKMSNWMNDTLAPGDTVDMMPPAGLF